MQIISAALSDRGCVREENEDRLLHEPAAYFFGVADGIGGLPFGGEAAECAIDALRQYLASTCPTATSPVPDLALLVRRVNEAAVAMARTLSPVRGLGCTLTFGCIRRDVLHLAHVGDSRAYLLSHGTLERLTVDHNVETDPLFRLSPARLAGLTPAHRGALTRCIGQFTQLEVDTLQRPLQTGDRILFCTDGVTRLVRDEELAESLAQHAASPATVLDELIGLAKRRGGYDNATGVLVQVD